MGIEVYRIMKTKRALFHLIVLLSLTVIHPLKAQEPDYKINPGDVLDVFVWNEESLTRQVVVRPDGYISMPLAGQIAAGGMSVKVVEDSLTSALAKFLKDRPTVTVSLMKLEGNKIYVLGKVNRPGEYIINSPIDVMQALALAGGLNAFASENNINVLRRKTNGKQVAIPFEYGEVKEGDDLETNIILLSGDIVVVP